MTPRERLAQARAGAARALSAAMDRAGVSHRALATAVGRSRGKIAKWTDAEGALRPTVADLRIMPTEVVRSLMSWVGEAHGLRVVDEADEEATHGDLLRALAASTKESGEANAAFAEAVADGVITPEEARHVMRQTAEAIRAHERLFAQAEAVANVGNVAPIKGRR